MRPLLLLLLPLSHALVVGEYGSYKNPHPRAIHKCDNADIAMLATCSNQVLAQLDDCKANDLACECCALQSMDPRCQNLCPGDPSANFLSVLVSDCAPLNDINACSLPFKKTDGDGRPEKVLSVETDNTISVKSQLLSKALGKEGKSTKIYSASIDSDSDDSDDEEKAEESTPPQNVTTRPALTLIRNSSNVTVMTGAAVSVGRSLVWAVIIAVYIMCSGIV